MKSCLILFTIVLAASAGGQSLRDEIVVTASSLPQTLEETAASVSILTREDLDRRAARDVVDVLREIPGIAVARTGTPGKATSLFLRGGSSKQALVLWNGVEMNNPYFSGYDFGQLSAAGVERVEVVRGPYSALYGSEAVAGVINVLTTPRASVARLEVEGGENKLFNAAASGALVRDRWSAHLTAERRSDDGFASNDDFSSLSWLGGVSTRITDRWWASVQARHAIYDLGIPFTPNAQSTAFVPSPDRRQEGAETQLAVPLRYATGRSDFELRFSESRRVEEFEDVAGPFGPESSDTDSRTRSARATARVGSLTVGGELERSVVDHVSGFSMIDARSRTNRSLFAEERFSLRGIELTAGLRYDDFETFGAEISPRVAVALLRGGNKFRAAYGEGFRAPAIGELYSPFFGNDALVAERSRTIEAGYERFAVRGSASVTLFRSEYEGLIVFGDDFRFQNIAAAAAHGVELAAARRIGRWNAAASYTWLKTEDDATREALLRRPEHSGSASAGYDAGRASAHLVVTHAGDRSDVTDLIPFGRVNSEAWTTADLVLAWRAHGYQPFVKVENLTGEEYQEVFGYPSAGRRIRAGVRFMLR